MGEAVVGRAGARVGVSACRRAIAVSLNKAANLSNPFAAFPYVRDLSVRTFRQHFAFNRRYADTPTRRHAPRGSDGSLALPAFSQ
jgi:hypothetical protein